MEFRLEGRLPGRINMERDARMLAEARPAVRVYGWQPACVSLGASQTESILDPDAVAAEGVDVVSRPTGGGALLHDENEVTYAIVVPRGWVEEDRAKSYRQLSRGVANALASYGLQPEYIEGSGGRQALCYLRHEGISVCVAGRKVSGGAQKRTRDTVLQHGTLLVTRDARRMARLLGGDPVDIAQATTCLADFFPPEPWQNVAERLLDAFRVAWAPLAQVHAV